MNTTVLFNDTEEFSKELEASPNVFEKIVRLTGQYRQTSIQPLRHLYLIGSFITMSAHGNKLVRLERYCGQVMMSDRDRDSKAAEIYATALKSLEDLVKKCGLEVRAGIYVVPETKMEEA